MVKDLIDKANLVNYDRPIVVEGVRPSIDDIPEYCKEDCKRIVSIFKKFLGKEITLNVAYDLWAIHSKESFCGCWENMEEVSDCVIYHNLTGLIKCIEFK